MYTRILSETILRKMGKGKAILVIGARQVGKTTLINQLLDGKSFLFLNADDPTVRILLDQPNTEALKSIIGKHRIVFVDEAQRIPGIGLTLKLITDQFKQVQLLVSGSSSFDLSSALNEPLTGRKWEYELLPISWQEYEQHHGYLTAMQQLENRLLYGFYPDVLNQAGEEVEILRQLVNSYLYRDLLAHANIRKPEVLEKLVLSLALQIGSEVNYQELAQQIGVDKNTVAHYIDILQKGYVVFRLGSFSRNLRNELKKSKKIYFYDLGIRNMVIGNFSPLEMRQDVGALWENFLVAERLKYNTYHRPLAKMYFWRTKQQQEIDLVEEINGVVSGFEFKWKTGKSAKPNHAFSQAYQATTQVIDRNHFRDFLMGNA